ncbi:MAG: response regulator [Gemmataceae bacterium]|nr:response regulator [Gemmataceae bacterium]
MPSDEKVNILLVDDLPSNLLALESMLEGLDQNLVKVRSGEEALRCLLEKDFCVILMDVLMPGMDGLETAALIRQRDRSRHTPIIFLTAFEKNDLQMFKGYSLGAVDYLLKPVVPAVLRSKVAVFVELYQKTEQIKRQAELLQETQRQEHEHRLAEEKQRWEMERLRAEAEKEKKVAEELARSIDQRIHAEKLLRERDRRKDEFLAMLGHELRNPLAPLLNALHLLRVQSHDPALVAQARDLAERQVRHLTRLVDDLLDVSRITRGKVELRKEWVELAPIVARAVDSTSPLIKERHHRLEVTWPDQPVRLEADPTRLEQILTNLLNNAAKYTEPGGQIRLIVERTGDEVVLRVQDNGIGMSPDVLSSIFELFVQAECSLARSEGGLGIGLTLVRSLVELHGGSVGAASEGPGRGSELVVRLPVQPEPPPVQAGAAPVVAASGRPGRVLVVDDNRDAAASLAMLLELEGHEVYLAHDGPAALTAARTHRPEVILLDIGLPGMDGYEVARHLRVMEGMQEALLVAMTGYGQEEDRCRALHAGFDQHLTKPVDPAEVQALVAKPRALAP